MWYRVTSAITDNIPPWRDPLIKKMDSATQGAEEES